MQSVKTDTLLKRRRKNDGGRWWKPTLQRKTEKDIDENM